MSTNDSNVSNDSNISNISNDINHINDIKSIDDFLNIKITIKYLIIFGIFLIIVAVLFYFIIAGDIDKGIYHVRFIIDYILKNIVIKNT